MNPKTIYLNAKSSKPRKIGRHWVQFLRREWLRDWRDLWVGGYWKWNRAADYAELEIYWCIIPILPIHVILGFIDAESAIQDR